MHLLYTSVNYLIRTLPQGKANTSSRSGWTTPSMRKETNRYLFACACRRGACARVHESRRNNREGVQDAFFLVQIRCPRTLMGNCALWDPVWSNNNPSAAHLLDTSPQPHTIHPALRKWSTWTRMMGISRSFSPGPDEMIRRWFSEGKFQSHYKRKLHVY